MTWKKATSLSSVKCDGRTPECVSLSLSLLQELVLTLICAAFRLRPHSADVTVQLTAHWSVSVQLQEVKEEKQETETTNQTRFISASHLIPVSQVSLVSSLDGQKVKDVPLNLFRD